MAFANLSDLNLSDARLVELTDSADAPGIMDAGLVGALQLRATSKIEAALYGKYSLDPDDFPPILTQIEADLWKFYLYQHRETMDTPSSVQKAYDAACALLEAYRTGAELLAAGRVNAATEPTSSVGRFSDDCDERVFGRAKDWI